MSIVTRIWGEVDGGVYEGPLQAPVWHRSGDLLVPATGNSNVAPLPGV